MKDSKRLAAYLLLLFALYVMFVGSAGYFGIGYLSDDHLNIISASSSTLGEKFTGKVPYYSPHHYRPAWFIAIEISRGLSEILGEGMESAIVSRALNLLLFLVLASLVAVLVFRLSGNVFMPLSAAAAVLLFPNNINSICWTIGLVDLMCGSLILSCLLYSLRYATSGRKVSALLSVVCLALALLTKETAVITALVCFLFLLWTMPAEKNRRAKLLAIQMLVTAVYIVFRLTVTGSGPAGMMTAYSGGGAGRAVVLIQAVLSAFIPFDYLTIRHTLSALTPLTLATISALSLLSLLILLIMIRNGSAGVTAKCSVLFFVTIIPNLFAGYFRPQLILIPFALTATLFMSLLSGMFSVRKLAFLPALLLVLLWTLISYKIIGQWKDASEISKRSFALLRQIPADEISDAVIIGLPGRLGQSHISEYVTGTYNCLNPASDGSIVSISDAVHTSALDEASLYSEIRHRATDSNSVEIFAAGETQYFQITGSRQDTATVNGVKIRLEGQNDFMKPTRVILETSGTQTPVYLMNNGKLSKLRF
ncbi:MAG: hypothetical protein K1X85_09210 [Ignavibacteria bacterium]|nr:hypothetical protein [Ignavibacteria bacterium]